MSRRRRVVQVVGAGLFGLWAEARWVAKQDYPEFPDLDASGESGVGEMSRLRVAAFGDSSLTGPGLESAEQIWLRQALDTELRGRYVLDSFAVGGARLVDVLSEQIPRIGSSRYHLIILSAGANDAIRGTPQPIIRERLKKVVDRLLESCDLLILTGVGDIGTAPRIPPPLSTVATVRSFGTDRTHEAVATKRDRVLKVPMWDLTTPRFRNADDLWSPDRFHPNANGHAVWAEALRPILREAVSMLRAVT